jgi:uncharacterized protein
MLRRILIVAAVLLLTVLGGASVFVGEGSLRMRRKPVSPIEGAEAVEIESFDGLALRGSYFASRAAKGAVILLHGQGDNRAGVAGFARFLVPAGYSALAPDIRAHGESGGELATYGLLESDDLRRWLDWIEAREPGARVFGLGESMGAGILLHSLARERRFCAVVAEAPFASLRGAARDRAGAAGWAVIELAALYQRARYGLDLTRVSPENAVARSRTRVLLIHGAADGTAPAWHARRIRERNPALVELWEVPGAGHTAAWSAAGVEFERRVLNSFDRGCATLK